MSAFDRCYWIMIRGRRGRITYAGREVIGKDTEASLGSVLFLVSNNRYLNSYFRRPANKKWSGLDGSYSFTNGIFREPGNGANI